MQLSEWTRPRSGVLLSPNKKMLVLKVGDAARFTNVFPASHCVTRQYMGMTLVGLPYQQDTLQMLRNLNCDTRGLEMMRHTMKLPLVEGQYALKPHQVTTAAFFTENPRAFCTSTMRIGKTASAIVAARFLQQRREMSGCLCIATKTNMWGVWQKEILGMYPDARIVVVHDKSPAERKRKLLLDADFYIINFDGIKIVREELLAMVDQGRINGCIVDEMTHYAQTQTQLWDAADQVINGTRWQVSPGRVIENVLTGEKTQLKGKRRRLPPGRAIKYCWGMTGTPGGPEMVYGQIKLITPNNMMMSFKTWRDQTMIQFGFKWVNKEGYKDRIYQAMQPCIRFDKNDVLDLPPVTFSGSETDLSKEQAKLYKEIRRDMTAMAGDVEVKAVTKAALVSKLLQIAGGVVKGEGGTVKALDIKPRVDHLEELIKTATQKVVIFCAFTAVIDRLHAELTERGYTVGIVDGRVTGTKREKVFSDFQNEKDPHIILCHPKTTAFGVELAAADTMIFYGPPISGEFVYQQAVERLSSLKQKAPVVQIIHQSATTEERKLFRSIKEGVSINEAINDMFTVSPDEV